MSDESIKYQLLDALISHNSEGANFNKEALRTCTLSLPMQR